MASIELKKGDKVWVKGSFFGEVVKTFKNKVKIKFLDPVFDSYGKTITCSEKDVFFTCRSRCVRCYKAHCDEDGFAGRKVTKGEDTLMWYGSRHDTEVYRFNLPEGWYCYACLDFLIDTKKTCKDTGKRTDCWGVPKSEIKSEEKKASISKSNKNNSRI